MAKTLEKVTHLTFDKKKKDWVDCNCEVNKDHYHDTETTLESIKETTTPK